VQLDRQPSAAAREGEVVLTAQQEPLLRRGQPGRLGEAERQQQLARARDVAAAHEYVEVYEASEREVAVSLYGERGAFVGEEFDARLREQARDAHKLAGEERVARRVLAELPAQPLAHGRRHAVRRRTLKAAVQERQHGVSACEVVEVVPVNRPARKLPTASRSLLAAPPVNAQQQQLVLGSGGREPVQFGVGEEFGHL
jgi:hypothetical protein